MNTEKLIKNLENLRSQIKRKPDTFTSEYAKTIEEAFTKYTRTRTVNLTLSLSEGLNEKNWPFPAYVPVEFSSLKWKLFIHLFPYVLIKKDFDTVMARLFNLYKKEIFLFWKSHPAFELKHSILEEVLKTYNMRCWASCITTAFPLLDHLCRQFLNTRRLNQEITHILGMFKAAGISSKDVKPGYIAWEVAKEKGLDIETATEKDLRLPGIALGSFIDIGSIYYGFYRKESLTASDLNRHAILHGASNNFWTKINATKLITFIDLTLRLEPVFKILMKED